MTDATLRTLTCKDLAQMAKREGVVGWHAMRKEELVDALAKAGRSNKRSRGAAPKSVSNGPRAVTAPRAAAAHAPRHAVPKRPSAARLAITNRINQVQARHAAQKSLAGSNGQATEVDRLVLMVRDAYWLQAYWEIAAASVDRARMAMGQTWHGAAPVLRVYVVAEAGSSTLAREIPIHGGVRHWYIDVQQSPQSFRAEIGYAEPSGQFYCIARSNTVSTPAPGAAEVDGNWSDVAENADRIYAMSGGYSDRGASLELQQLLEQRLHRRLGRPSQTRFGGGAQGPNRDRLRLAIDAELVIYGATEPNAHVTVEGEPVSVRPDGTFAVRMQLPDRRQVVPVVASSPDGSEQKTIILGLERNTKELELVSRDQSS